jgi:hydrogenase maturation protease
MLEPKHQTIIIGYGNPGRQDDGLGPSFIKKLTEQLSKQRPELLSQQQPKKDQFQIHLQSSYQLTVEDAYDIVEYDQVIFVDASLNAQAPFSFTKIANTNDSGLGSHSLTPNAVIRLCETLYDKTPKAFILAIKGYEFDQFDEHLSSQAKTNMLVAVQFLIPLLSEGLIEGSGGDTHQASAHA